MPIRRIPGVAALALLLAACGGSGTPHADGLDPSPDPLSSFSLVRLPRSGGAAARHALPSLEAEDWAPRERLPALRSLVGVDPDLPAVYALRRDGGVVVLDLAAGTVRVTDPEARYAVLGADHTLYTLGEDGTAVVTVRRAPRTLRGRVDRTPLVLAGTVNDHLVAVAASGDPRGQVLSAEGEPTTQALPAGPVAASEWGDQVVVAASEDLVWWSPRTMEVRRERLREAAMDLALSPSGHAAWVLGAQGQLARYDRYAGGRRAQVELPGPARELRMDPLGAWLLVRPASGDSVWLVDVAEARLVGATAAPWDADLPAMAGARLLLVRDGDDMVAHDLTAPGMPEAGRVEGGAGSLWAVVPRARVRRHGEPDLAIQPEPAASTAEPEADAAPGAPGARTLYLQLSSSRNPEWAADLARQLRQSGVEAAVLPASTVDNLYRVVVGPFATRDEAERVARDLGRPSFIFQRPEGTR